jgi:hypothetical protein
LQLDQVIGNRQAVALFIVDEVEEAVTGLDEPNRRHVPEAETLRGIDRARAFSLKPLSKKSLQPH